MATWDSLASTCASGDGVRMPGHCVEWQWCGHAAGQEPRSLADRPDLAPARSIPETHCCCDVFDGARESFSVQGKDACARSADAHCVDAGFCDRPGG